MLFVVGWSDWTFSFDCRGITYLNAFSVSYGEIGDYLVQVVCLNSLFIRIKMKRNQEV